MITPPRDEIGSGELDLFPHHVLQSDRLCSFTRFAVPNSCLRRSVHRRSTPQESAVPTMQRPATEGSRLRAELLVAASERVSYFCAEGPWLIDGDPRPTRRFY